MGPKVKLALWLMLVAVSAGAQQRTVSVRLFWQHPPSKIRVEPVSATVRSCAACAAKNLTSPLEVDAKRGALFLDGRARISGDGFAPFSVDGQLTIQPNQDVLLLSLQMPIEDYVAAVLQGESGGFQSNEALKAMAVAARTYAAHFGSRHKPEGFDFCDTTHCQDVRLGNESPRVRAAVAETESEILWYQGKPAATYYHRSCGGEIEDATALDPSLHVPYLRHHVDQFCSRSDEWEVKISKRDLSHALGRNAATVRVVARSESGRVRTLLISGKPMSGTEFRLAVGRALGWDKIRSDLYQLEDLGDAIAIRGRGQGHGVGLCQVGADAMGQQGRGYREILAYYYPGTSLGINARGLAWKRLPGQSVEIVSTNESDAARLLPVAEGALQSAVERVGWGLKVRPQIRVYPTMQIYRDATGEPGWVAASTRGAVIRLQPLDVLIRRHALEETLQHEFLHMVVESEARRDLPLWFQEGLVIYLDNPAIAKPVRANPDELERRLHAARTESDMRAAYRGCANFVADLVSRFGRATVLNWARNGLPEHF